MGAVRLKVSATGEVSLPDELRKALGVEGGGELLATYEDRLVWIQPRQTRLSEIGAELNRAVPEGVRLSVDDFLAQRRRDAAKE